MRIGVTNLQGTALDLAFVRRVAARAARDAGARAGTLTIALVDDGRITALNRAHRRRNRPTDVLAYEGDEDSPGYLGDVVVSVDTAARQATEVGRPLLHEVAWLAAHGVLHLLGQDDATAIGRATMIAQQDRALAAHVKAGTR